MRNKNQIRLSPQRSHPWHWIILALAVTLVGMLTTIYIGQFEVKRLESSLTERAQTIAASVDISNLEKLSGTEADIDSEIYQRLKASLAKIHSVNSDSRFVYLMGIKKGQLFFFVDSENASSPDYSPPGQIYSEASLEKIINVRQGKTFVEGPYTDRWGNWVSGYAPLIDPETGKVLGSAGIDISSRIWQQEILYAQSLPALATLFILVVLLFSYRAQRRRNIIDQMKSEFVSLASHQLKTPLTGIKWVTGLLLHNVKEPLSTEQKDYVQQISEANLRMMNLVNDLLSLSHIESGNKFNLVPKPTNIIPIVSSLNKEMMALTTKRNIKVDLSKLPQKLLLNVDPEKIRQVFQNLMSNAIKYSKEKGIVEIGQTNPTGKNMATLYIKDRGVGIPKKQQYQVFEKFFRAENVFSEEMDGTGLGMYIAKSITEKHGGKLWFESEQNVGTTFYISLPIVN